MASRQKETHMSHYVVGVEQVDGPDTATPFDTALEAVQFVDKWKTSGAKVTVFRDGTPIDEGTLRQDDEDERTVTLK